MYWLRVEPGVCGFTVLPRRSLNSRTAPESISSLRTTRAVPQRPRTQRLPSATKRIGRSRASAFRSPEPASVLAASTWPAAIDEIISAPPEKGTISISSPTSRKYPRSTPMYPRAVEPAGELANLTCPTVAGGAPAADAGALAAPLAPAGLLALVPPAEAEPDGFAPPVGALTGG